MTARNTTFPPNIRPILLLEINEVPWRLLDWARDHFDLPNLEAFFQKAATYTTVSSDLGELSPWVTWPSFHRGMNNEAHGIKNLGQDVTTFRGVPIWDEYLSRGLSVGVCGSLQSWPPKPPGQGGFYVPDTFAHDDRCEPAWVEPLQRFNLAQVRINGRQVSSKIALSNLELIPSLLKARMSPHFFLEVARQLAFERVDPVRLARRPTFQAMLYWEVFERLFDGERPPAFSTFFTNHIAGLMHRYWNHIFPEDFPEQPKSALRPHVRTFEFAFRVVDRILQQALHYQRQCPELAVVFASSMGQAAVHRDHNGHEVVIGDVIKLLQALGLPTEDCRPLLAMVPQVAVAIESTALRTRAVDLLRRCKAMDGSKIFEVDVQGATVTITSLMLKRQALEAGEFQLGDQKTVRFETAHIEVLKTEAGTGYHIPEGSLAVVANGVSPNDLRTAMPAVDAKAFLMRLGGLTVKRKASAPKKVSRPRHAKSKLT
jgi:hypothetical protein